MAYEERAEKNITLHFVPAKEVLISLDNAALDTKEKHYFLVLNPMGLLDTSPLKVKT